MITQTTTKVLDLFSDSHGNTFKVVAQYCPNEENDPWVKYVNQSTNQEYSCRKEAFLSRFNPLPK